MILSIDRLVMILSAALIVCMAGGARSASAQYAAAPWSPASLAQLGPAQLETLYRQSPVAPLPTGWVRGTPLVSPGSRSGPLRSRAGRAVWQGKWFEPATGMATNRFFGLRAITGQTSLGPSWLDGQPALILDYEYTSRIYQPYRDEIRQVAPGVYLGFMYDRRVHPPRLVRTFVLETAAR